MTAIKLPEDLQGRILEYYEARKNVKIIRNMEFYKILNPNLIKLIKLFQTEEAIRDIGLFDIHNIN